GHRKDVSCLLSCAQRRVPLPFVENNPTQTKFHARPPCSGDSARFLMLFRFDSQIEHAQELFIAYVCIPVRALHRPQSPLSPRMLMGRELSIHRACYRVSMTTLDSATQKYTAEVLERGSHRAFSTGEKIIS
ncbi:unnamed protein product, partial [Mycena citricolor]